MMCICIGMLSCILPLVDVIEIQVVTIILACLFRSFLVGTTATFLNLCFPSEHFGKLYGITRTIGGCSTFLAVPIFKWVSSGSRYDYGNLLFVVMTGLTLVFPFQIWRTAVKSTVNDDLSQQRRTS